MTDEDSTIGTFEDFTIEKIVEPIYCSNIKQEIDFQTQEESFETIFESNEHACVEKEKPRKNELYHCAPCNLTFTCVEQHLKENHTAAGDCIEANKSHLSIKRTDNFQFNSSVVNRKSESFLKTNQNLDPYQCKTLGDCSSISENQTKTKEVLWRELNIREEFIPSAFACAHCPKTFSVVSMLHKHQKSHKEKKANINKDGKDEKNDELEVEINHCEICNTTFSSSKNLKLHSKMHLKIQTKSIRDAMPAGVDSKDTNLFYCEICNKSFDHSLLSVHQNMHQNVEELNCSICNRQFENQISYDMHMQLHAEKTTRVRALQIAKPGARFTCNYCGKDFLRPHEKVKHERIHTGEKPHECEVCGKSFRVSYSLTLHLRTHTDVRPFVCAQCNKRFKSYAVYSHHLNTHSEDRPYKCQMCPKSFRTSVQLCGHRNSHTKPYNCPECNRPFSSLYAVKMHMKTHNKANKSNENLKHRCEMCGAVYARMFALRFHMKEQHSTDLFENEVKIVENIGEPGANSDDCFNEDEVSTQASLRGEEIIIDTLQAEEIVTDW